MDDALISKIKNDMYYEFARSAPPEGFPKFPDISTERHRSQEFHDLEQAHLWPKTWVMAGRAEDVPDAGDYFVFKNLGVPLRVVRGTDGTIRCCYNTGQHRGCRAPRPRCGSGCA